MEWRPKQEAFGRPNLTIWMWSLFRPCFYYCFMESVFLWFPNCPEKFCSYETKKITMDYSLLLILEGEGSWRPLLSGRGWSEPSLAFLRDQGKDVWEFFDYSSCFEGTFEMFQDAGFWPGFDWEGKADELESLFVDHPFFGIELVNFVQFPGEFREKFFQYFLLYSSLPTYLQVHTVKTVHILRSFFIFKACFKNYWNHCLTGFSLSVYGNDRFFTNWTGFIYLPARFHFSFQWLLFLLE